DPTLVPTVISVGKSIGSGRGDIELNGVSLTFSNLAFASGKWGGTVGVSAQTGDLFPGLLDISVTDDGTDIASGNDADQFGVVGTINLAQGNDTSFLKLDPIDTTALGVPKFFDVHIQDLRLKFTDFRSDDNLNSLHLEFALKGFDTGNDFFNSQLRNGANPFI